MTLPEGSAPAPAIRMERVALADLPGWKADDPGAALAALRAHCTRWKWRKGPLAEAMQQACAADWSGDPRAVLDTHFSAWHVQGTGAGLLTGYFEPTYRGARTPSDAFAVPLLGRPDDLVEVDLGAFREDLKGERIAGRLEGSRLVPYPDRAAIRTGALEGRAPALFWLADPVDLFFLQIQGSGRIALDDGGVAHVGYAAQNGRPYRAIGRDLIARGAVPREKMSMQAIRDWLTANPSEAEAVMDLNPSYVFFSERDSGGAVGAAGLKLTPGRSIAVDHRFWNYGLPAWIAAPGQDDDPPLARLVVAEDTGGAIRGAVRADLFLGPGDEAARLAGRMNRPLDLWILLPKSLTPTDVYSFVP